LKNFSKDIPWVTKAVLRACILMRRKIMESNHRNQLCLKNYVFAACSVSFRIKKGIFPQYRGLSIG